MTDDDNIRDPAWVWPGSVGRDVPTGLIFWDGGVIRPRRYVGRPVLFVCRLAIKAAERASAWAAPRPKAVYVPIDVAGGPIHRAPVTLLPDISGTFVADDPAGSKTVSGETLEP
jgi:hypothetical protein